MDDLTAIVEHGGVSTAEFPALERDLDYIVNYYFPYPTGPLQEAVLDDIVQEGAATLDIALSQHAICTIDHETIARLDLAIAGDQTWSIDHSGDAIAEFQLVGNSIWEIAGVGTAAVEVSLSGALDWTVAGSGEIDVAVDLVHSHQWEVANAATGIVETVLAQNANTTIAHDGSARVAIDITYSSTFSIQHRGVIRAKDRVNETLPVWSFEPNWTEGILETLEWMTDVLRSPSGAEQRRSLRPFPRRSFEFSIALQGSDRALFNNLIFAHGAHDWYLPLWHDAHYLDSDVDVETFVIPCSTAAGNFAVGELLFIGQGGSRKFDLVEVLSISGDNVTLVEPVDNAWKAGTQIYPVRLARLTEQPTPRRASDNTVTSPVRFRLVEQNDGVPEPSGLDTYRSFSVLSSVPDENETLDLGYERILEEVDNQTAIPLIYDSANISFPVQKHSWALNGRSEHSEFLSLVYDLRGKARPLWLPTFFEDFTLAAEGAAGSTSLHVANVGYSATGGPRDSRRDIMIELLDGSRLYRRITASTALGDVEVLAVDSPLPALNFTNVFRISFMALNRLNQDQIELNHETDVEGVTRVVATFRSTPDLRQANVGF